MKLKLELKLELKLLGYLLAREKEVFSLVHRNRVARKKFLGKGKVRLNELKQGKKKEVM